MAPQGFTVGGTLGLTLDTYGRHWPTFVSLALVPALLAGLAALDRSFGPVSIVAIAVAGIVALVTTGAVTAGTDDHLSSRPLAAGPLLRTGLRRTPALFGAAILMGLFAGLVSLVAVPIVFFATLEGVDPLLAGAIILGLAIVAAVALWYVFTRLALFTPAIVLADRGPVAGIAESWRVTRGHVLRLIGLLIIIGLLTTFATSGAAGIATFSPNRLIGALATVLATAIVLPVLSIASAVAYGLVSDRWRDAPAPAREGSPRRSALALLLGVGLLMSVVGAVFSVQFLTSTFLFGAPPDAGLVVAGTDRDPDAPCRPLNRTTEFTTTDPIYIAAYFSKPLQPGETADVTFFVDGQQAQTLAIAAEAQRVGCYYEQDAIPLAPGTYRLLIERGKEVLADGEFVVR